MNLRFRYESEIQEASLKLGDEPQIDLWFDGVFGGTGTRGGLGSAVWVSNVGSSRGLAGGVVGSGGLRTAGLAVLRSLGFGFCAGLLCCVCPVRVVLVCVWACPARCWTQPLATRPQLLAVCAQDPS